jgi:hypothetical protein
MLTLITPAHHRVAGSPRVGQFELFFFAFIQHSEGDAARSFRLALAAPQGQKRHGNAGVMPGKRPGVVVYPAPRRLCAEDDTGGALARR